MGKINQENMTGSCGVHLIMNCSQLVLNAIGEWSGTCGLPKKPQQSQKRADNVKQIPVSLKVPGKVFVFLHAL